PSATSSKEGVVEDDYPRALKAAKAAGKLIFADTWAVWCHSCMSMKQYVLPAPEMQALAPTFVWLSVDSEKAENADFLERFPSTSIPTLWVIDPVSERALLKWVGAATAPELATLLDDASRARTGTTSGEAAAATLRGDQASALGKPEEAVSAYREALTHAPLVWERRPRVVEALSARLLDAERYAECVELAATELPRLPFGTPLANLAMNGLSAAAELPGGAPALKHVPLLVREGTRIVEDKSEGMLVDDRSGVFRSLVAALADRPAEVKRLARSWAKLLEGAAAKATSAEQRAVWDPHRLEAYIALGEVESAVPMLEQSEREFPDDYNPPFRLGRAYFELQRYEPALIEVRRALERASGPRKLRIFMLKADILEAQKDREGARRAIGEAVDFANRLRLPPNYRKLKDKLAQRYASLQ
ncbi:MAG TPA: thioredoxin family protein, partial [Polyangiaceae bacterium]|nr:thioredoxin family protein [Polyangiaceae bacterium]